MQEARFEKDETVTAKSNNGATDDKVKESKPQASQKRPKDDQVSLTAQSENTESVDVKKEVINLKGQMEMMVSTFHDLTKIWFNREQARTLLLKNGLSIPKALREGFELTPIKRSGEESDHFCIFCDVRFGVEDLEKTIRHYLQHLSISLVCLKCDIRFADLPSFRSHRHYSVAMLQSDVNQKNFLDMHKWARSFLAFQKSDACRRLSSGQFLCPVCSSMSEPGNPLNVFQNVSQVSSQPLQESVQSVRQHLHQHLNYLPYTCQDCEIDEQPQLQAFCLIDDNIRRHLIDVHGHNQIEISSKSNGEIAMFFHKTWLCPLEKLIQYYVDLNVGHKAVNS